MLMAIGITILKITLIVILIGVMVLALTALNYSMLLRSHRSDVDDAARLRREVKNSDPRHPPPPPLPFSKTLTPPAPPATD